MSHKASLCHLPNVYLQFLCIKTLTLQNVYEISSKWFEALHLVGAIGNS